MSSRPQTYRILFLEAGEGMGGSTHSLITSLEHLNKERFLPYVGFYFFNSGPDTNQIRNLGVCTFFLSQHERDGAVPFRVLPDKLRWRWWHNVKVLFRFAGRFISGDLPQWWRLVRWIRREKISLTVLNNDVHYHLVGMLAAKVTRTPVICRKAGGIGEHSRIKRWLTPWVDVFMCTSKATRDDQERNNPGTKRIVTLFGGIDTKMFEPLPKHLDLCKTFGIQKDEKCVAYVSRIVEGKGLSEFLDSAALIVKEFGKVKFVIVGAETQKDGSLLTKLQTKVQLLGLEHYVRFSGWRTDMPAVFSVVDIFVHCPTTWIEGLAMSVMEAMATGKPMVVSHNGGLVDAVIDGVTGFIVRPGDIQMTAEAVVRLLKDEDLARTFGRKGRERAIREFDVERNTRHFEMLCEEYAVKTS